jgi:P4 family phage/plasmid primase-like protien
LYDLLDEGNEEKIKQFTSQEVMDGDEYQQLYLSLDDECKQFLDDIWNKVSPPSVAEPVVVTNDPPKVEVSQPVVPTVNHDLIDNFVSLMIWGADHKGDEEHAIFLEQLSNIASRMIKRYGQDGAYEYINNSNGKLYPDEVEALARELKKLDPRPKVSDDEYDVHVRTFAQLMNWALDNRGHIEQSEQLQFQNQLQSLASEIIKDHDGNVYGYINSLDNKFNSDQLKVLTDTVKKLKPRPEIMTNIVKKAKKSKEAIEDLFSGKCGEALLEFIHSPENRTAAKLFVAIHPDDITLHSDKGPLFMWNEETKLWIIHEEVSILINMVANTLEKFLKEKKLVSANDVKSETSEFRSKRLSIESLINNALLKIQKSSFIDGTIKFVKGMIKDTKFADRLNASVHLLSVKGGKVINFRTGEVLERTKEHYLTKEIDVYYNPDACSEVFDNFMSDIMLDDVEMINYLEDLFGYFVTGEIVLRSLYILVGSGSNGKSTLLNLLKSVFGPYCSAVSKYCFIKRNKNGALNPEYENLIGTRLALCSELDRGDVLDAGGVKTMTGDDTTPFRLLFKGMALLDAQFKAVIATNLLPEIDVSDYAIMERCKIINFTAHFYTDDDDENITSTSKKIDTGMKEKLHTTEVKEYILRIAVERAVAFYANNRAIPTPDRVKLNKKNLKTNSEKIYDFLKEEVVVGGGDKWRCGVTQLYDEYVRYSLEHGQTKPLTRDEVSNRVTKLSGVTKKKSNIKIYTGIKLGVPCPHGDSIAECTECLLAGLKF